MSKTASKSSKRSRAIGGAQTPFTPDEEQYLVELKNMSSPGLGWKDIHDKFTKRFPTSSRTRGGLQVHYSRKLHIRSKTSDTILAGTSSTANIPFAFEPASATTSVVAADTSVTTDNFLPKSVPSDVPPGRPRRAAAQAVTSYKDLISYKSQTKNTRSGKATSTKKENVVNAPTTDNNLSSKHKPADHTITKRSTTAISIIQLSTDPAAANSTVPHPDYPITMGEVHQLVQPGANKPPPMEGWIPAKPAHFDGLNDVPRIFRHPCKGRVIEYNTRSKSFRTRWAGFGEAQSEELSSAPEENPAGQKGVNGQELSHSQRQVHGQDQSSDEEQPNDQGQNVAQRPSDEITSEDD